jgi:hypothetical protein
MIRTPNNIPYIPAEMSRQQEYDPLSIPSELQDNPVLMALGKANMEIQRQQIKAHISAIDRQYKDSMDSVAKMKTKAGKERIAGILNGVAEIGSGALNLGAAGAARKAKLPTNTPHTAGASMNAPRAASVSIYGAKPAQLGTLSETRPEVKVAWKNSLAEKGSSQSTSGHQKTGKKAAQEPNKANDIEQAPLDANNKAANIQEHAADTQKLAAITQTYLAVGEGLGRGFSGIFHIAGSCEETKAKHDDADARAADAQATLAGATASFMMNGDQDTQKTFNTINDTISQTTQNVNQTTQGILKL